MPKDTISSNFVDMNNLEMSNEVKPLFDKVVKHIKENARDYVENIKKYNSRFSNYINLFLGFEET